MTAARPRLSPERMGDLPASVRRPLYDRRSTRLTVAHIGVGAFHRCHQAEYLEDVLAGGHDDQALIGINLRAPQIVPLLTPQDCLYTRTLVQEDARDLRVIGCIGRVIDAGDRPDAALAVIADPAVTTVTLTVTEKAYCHSPATGLLDEAHADIVADLAGASGPALSVPGFLIRGLALRAAAGAGPVNLISCDNIPDNGRILQAVTTGFARRASPSLVAWIADNVAFPSTMVDRIVPASTPELLAEVAEATGCDDAAVVQGEMFRQWVIADDFRAPRPRWEAAGVEIATNVAGHEHVKMRVLNAAQTMAALLGCLAGHSYSFQAVRDPAIRAFVEQTLVAETLPHLPKVSGMAGAGYLAQSLRRIGNGGIHHLNSQIATDTSQKIRQRLLDPLRAARTVGRSCAGLTCGVAAWLAYMARSGQAFGARWVVSDPVMLRVTALLAGCGTDIDSIARAVLGLEDVFGPDLSRDAGFATAVAAHLRRLLTGPLDAALAAARGDASG